MGTNKKKYKTVLMHRAVWESWNMSCLLKWAHVHHIDGNVWNNDISNLQAMMDHQHRSINLGYVKIPSSRKCSECGSSTTYFLGRYHHWHRNPVTKEIICGRCHGRIYYRLNKRV